MARGLRVIALLILTLPLLAPSAAAQEPQLAAEWTAEGLVVTITSETAWRKQVVVTLDDRVERVVSLNQEAGTTRVTIPDIATRSVARVSLLQSFPYVHQTSLPDVVMLRNAANSVLVPIPQAPMLEARGRVTKVAEISSAVGGDGRAPQALVTASSIVVVGYVEGGVLWVQSSFDGGRTFGAALNLTDKVDSTPYYVWGMAEVEPNVVEFAFHPRESADLDWRVVRYDASKQWSTGTSFFRMAGQGGSQAVAIAPDGRGVYAFVNGTSIIDVWGFAYQSAPHFLARLDAGELVVEAHVATNGDRVAVAVLKGPAGGPFSQHAAFSNDGGKSFGAFVALDPDGLQKGGMLEQTMLLLGEKIVAHSAFAPSVDAQNTRTVSAYARVNGNSASTRVFDGGIFPALGMRGNDFWAHSGTGTEYHFYHSSDEGASFDENYSLERGQEAFGPWRSQALAIFPDGRPLLSGYLSEADNKWFVGVMPLFDPFDTTNVVISREAPSVPIVIEPTGSGLFFDSFEEGIAPAWDPTGVWTINDSTAHLGTRSAYSAPGTEHIASLARELEPIPNTTLSAWYYDWQDGCGGDETTQVLIAKSNAAGRVVNLGVGVITGVSKCNYAWLEWTGNSTYTESNQPRSRGWHKFEIISRTENATILIDGKVIAERAPMGAPMKLILGDPWGPTDEGLVANAGGLWDDASYALSLGLPIVEPPPITIPTVITKIVETQLVIVAVAPASVTIAPGGQGGVIITIQNRGTLAATLRAPNVTGVPVDLSILAAEGAGIEIEPGGERSLQLAVAASASALAQNVSIHWEMDSLSLDVPIRIGLATVTIEPGAPLPSLPVVVEIAAGLGAVAVGVALVARSVPGKMLSGTLLIPLYSRLKKREILKHEVRAGVHSHIAKNPGVRYEELRRALELPNGVLAFHLRVLQREGYVATRAAWTRRTYYATGSVMPTAPAARLDVLVALLTKNPGLTPSEVAARLSMSRQLAHYHLRSLERQGAIRSRSAAGTRVYESVALSREGQS